MKRFVSVGECMVELAPDGEGWRMGIAGDTFNTAWYARALLPDTWEVAYLTCLGLDPFSDRALQVMRDNGIATDLVQRHPSRSIGLYGITLEDGERSFSYWRDTSAARTLADDQAVLAAALRDADLIHVSGITLAILPPDGRARLITTLTQARARGAITVLDPNYRPRLWADDKTAAQAITKAAQSASIVLPSFGDEAALFGDPSAEATARRYSAAGAQIVAVKNADSGVTLIHDGQLLSLTDLPRVTPRDTTGAGDSFNAAFLASLLGGADTESSARAGHALACQVVAHLGALIDMKNLRMRRREVGQRP